MASRTLSAKRARYGAYVSLYIIVVLAVLVVLNWLASQNNKSFDTTTNKQYSLSEQTVKTVKNLKSPIYVTYFNQSTRFGTARDLLDRYGNLSNKVKIKYVDPEKQPDVARADGFRSEGGVVVRSGDRTEEASTLTEEGVTNAIIRSNKTTEKTVCFVTGSGEMSLDDSDSSGLSFAKDSLAKDTYKTSTFSMLEKQQVPAECAAVILAGPKRDYADAETAALKSYVAAGGHVLLALGPSVPTAGKGSASESAATPNLNNMAVEWGITLDGDLVLDPESQIYGFNEAVPIGATYAAQPIVRDIARIATVFPLSQSLTLSKGAEQLISTSAGSVSIPHPAATIKVDPASAKKGPFILAAVSTTGAGAHQGRVVVVGSSGWMGNSALKIGQVANRDLFLNSVNWLCADEDLISIRPKDPDDRRISLTNSQGHVLFFSTVLLLPLLVIVSGVSTWWKRR